MECNIWSRCWGRRSRFGCRSTRAGIYLGKNKKQKIQGMMTLLSGNCDYFLLFAMIIQTYIYLLIVAINSLLSFRPNTLWLVRHKHRKNYLSSSNFLFTKLPIDGKFGIKSQLTKHNWWFIRNLIKGRVSIKYSK